MEILILSLMESSQVNLMSGVFVFKKEVTGVSCHEILTEEAVQLDMPHWPF